MISCIYIDTEDLVLELDRASESADSALEWVERMRDTLIFGGRRKNPLPFGMHCITVSKGYVANGKIGRWKRNAIAELRNRGVDSPDDNEITEEIYARHGSEYEEAMSDIAAASAAKKNGFTAAAPHREAGDVSANGCNQLTADGDIREDSQDVHNTGDRGILESGTSANHYDKEAAPTSTNGPRQAEARQSPRAGGNSVKVAKVSTPPVRSSVPAKKAHGEFGNVMLTDDEFGKLCEKCADADALITELDQYIESQGKTKKYKSHYATLLNWSRRKAQESKPVQRFKNINDINRENCEQIERDLRAMFHPEEVL